MPQKFKWQTWGESGLYPTTITKAPSGGEKRKRSNAGLLSPPKKTQAAKLESSPPPAKPILDPNMPAKKRDEIIKNTREKIINAQRLYLQLTRDIGNRSMREDLKLVIEESKKMRNMLQEELGDSLFETDLGEKRERGSASESDGSGIRKKRRRKGNTKYE